MRIKQGLAVTGDFEILACLERAGASRPCFPLVARRAGAGQEGAKLGSHEVPEIEIRSKGSGLRLRPRACARPDCKTRPQRIDRR